MRDEREAVVLPDNIYSRAIRGRIMATGITAINLNEADFSPSIHKSELFSDTINAIFIYSWPRFQGSVFTLRDGTHTHAHTQTQMRIVIVYNTYLSISTSVIYVYSYTQYPVYNNKYIFL